MIKHFRFIDWKSYADGTLFVDALTILIGTNSSGKSNALDGIELLSRLANSIDVSTAIVGDPINSPIRGGAEWAARHPNNRFTLETLVVHDETTEYLYSITIQIDPRIQIASEKLLRYKYRTRQKLNKYTVTLFSTDEAADDHPSLIARLYNEKSGTKKEVRRSQSIISQLFGLTLRSEIDTAVKSVVTSLRNIFILDPYPSKMRQFVPLSERLQPDGSNIAGVIAALGSKKRDEIEGQLQFYMTQLPEKDITRIWSETVGRFQSDAMIYCEESWRDGDITTVDARGMSDGTLRFLSILTALLTRPKGSLLVIEEIDNGLHPSRANLLLRMLTEVGSDRQVDVIITTHNPALLDALTPDFVPFISVAFREEGTGYSKLLPLDEVPRIAKLLAIGPVGTISTSRKIEEAVSNA
ncbi:AAA family ATPase [Methylobacterium sp. J-077]|uniref:AAA family ATPase n=1 Tax=Methylobacterium sp. J-077 TaxID=2836656 RepID=UPI001FBAC102|nr:ATP-binding protein [Methylobacterium sp. J-077]MCJ2121843.1 ATP-binding protein [Methylobacterium sp. J-077]